ncbi:hypothetical protein OIDMADRAFT_170974 [Oidiodendron maius Zn]|uniref:Heterokaryon incompatibility domain-containing protein n=1 Tax=Oidiodendron maius (strain Zn) TaxID=913774 RepID=A0A0C3C9G2_OIDMZ|nr:hypothetical protein OIDMADRAFT_170974 [Oidiodendron maius Zn]
MSDGGIDDYTGLVGWHKKGLGLKEWLDGIRSGDAIQILPKAEYAQWNNFVSKAQIEVWVEVLVTRARSAASTYLGNDYSAYRQLVVENKEIRLVEIEPRASDDDEDAFIQLSLKYTALSDLHRISYEALSYTWGDDFSPQTIFVMDGDKSTSAHPMSVNSNLFGALRHLRRRDMSRVMWIDLLSINQTDVVERSQQVAIMGDIFAAATAVQVWLGDLNDHLREDFELKATDPRDKIFALLTFGDETHCISTLPDMVRPDYSKSTARILSAIHTLHGRTWLDMSGPNSSEKLDLSQRPSWTLWSSGRSEWQHATLALRSSCRYRASGDRHVDLDLLASLRSTNSMTIALKGIRVTSIAKISPYRYYQQPILSRGIREAYNAIFAPALVRGQWTTLSEIDLQHTDVETLARVSEKTTHETAARDHVAAHRAGKSGDGTYLPCHGNCGLETADGAFGLCPSSAQVSDVVVVLYGGRVPYLLRPTETPTEFYLIGECYVEGIMYGEALVSTSCTLTEEVFLLV